MSKKDYTPEEITDKLIGFDPTEPEEPSQAIEIPKQEFYAKKSPTELLKDFLDTNNLVLTVSPPNENIKTVSDGSIILSAPKILVNYK